MGRNCSTFGRKQKGTHKILLGRPDRKGKLVSPTDGRIILKWTLYTQI